MDIQLAYLLAQTVMNLPANTGDPGSIPGLRRSSGEGNGNTRILAWRIPWTKEPVRLQAMLQRGNITEQLMLSRSLS